MCTEGTKATLHSALLRRLEVATSGGDQKAGALRMKTRLFVLCGSGWYSMVDRNPKDFQRWDSVHPPKIARLASFGHLTCKFYCSLML